MIKRKLVKILLPYLIVLIGLSFTGFVPFTLVSSADSTKVEPTENKVEEVIPSAPTPSASPKPIKKVAVYQSPTPAPTQTLSSTPTPTQASTPAPTPVAQTNQVSLSINGSPAFSVSVIEGANQCDLLNKALEEGKISSLNMRYDSNLGAYAVYQINGLGKENSVWWTYKVNGQSPPQGCSYIKAKEGDSVEWEYIGS